MYTFMVPARFQGRTGYHIFVDRFKILGGKPKPMEGRLLKDWQDAMPNWWPDGDGEYRNQYFYGGNLNGIKSELPFLKSMGFDLLYLSPISYTCESHHYDVCNQIIIDPWIGDENDFRELCDLAHSLDVLVCVDLVFNHMGRSCDIFQRAIRGESHQSWFEWNEGKPVYWYGFKNLPQCDKMNSEYQEYAANVCEYYVSLGADGIRFDLGESLPREFMSFLRKRIKSVNPDVLMVSETWGFAHHNTSNIQIFGNQVDSVMNYPFLDAVERWIRFGNVPHLTYTWNELAKYPKQVRSVLWNFLDSHDTPRVLNMLAGDGIVENPFEAHLWEIEAPWRQNDSFLTYDFRKWEADMGDQFDIDLGIKRLKLASLLQYFEEGMPIVYYGSEVGVTGYKDPFNRAPYPWGKTSSLTEHYRSLGMFRKENRDVLANGETCEIEVTEKTLVKVRMCCGKVLILVVNRTGSFCKNPVGSWNTSKWQEVFSIGDGNSVDNLVPYGAVVYRTNIW